MGQGEVLGVAQQAIFTIITVASPMLIVSLVIGLVVSIFQATTQINEQTMVFVPKILGILLALIIFGGWMLTQLTDFTVKLFQSINTFVR